MFKFGRHEIRFILSFCLLLAFTTVIGVLATMNGTARQFMQAPVVPPAMITAAYVFGSMAAPLIIIAGAFPAEKGDILKWK